jgi:hypothetical protein
MKVNGYTKDISNGYSLNANILYKTRSVSKKEAYHWQLVFLCWGVYFMWSMHGWKSAQAEQLVLQRNS